MKLYNTLAEIDAAVVKFAKAGQSVQTEAHKLACSVLRHVGEHGDVRVVTNFLSKMPEMARVNALKAWFENFGPVSFGTKDEIAYVKGAKTQLGAAIDMPFWKFKPEAPYQPMDVAKALESLIKKLEKDAKATGRVHNATIAALKQAPVNAMLMLCGPTSH